MAIDDLNNSVRETRAAQSRDRNVRNKPWQPPSVLDAPDAPEGYVYRWIRESMVGNDDKANMSKRIREGWEPVRAEEHPDFETPVVEEGKYAGVIGVGGLILAKMPIEIVEQRKAYFRNMTSDQIQAVDRNLMRESNPVMPIETPQRSTKVTFGSGGSKGES